MNQQIDLYGTASVYSRHIPRGYPFTRTIWLRIPTVVGLLVATAALLVVFLVPYPASSGGTTWNVNSTADDDDGSCDALPGGDCTLRAALAATANGDSAHFNIPGADPGCSGGLCTIQPTEALVELDDGVTIDGYTQPGAGANTLLVGNNATIAIENDMSGVIEDGLIFTGSDNIVRGLVVNGLQFTRRGVVFADGARNALHGSYIGTEFTGSIDASAGGTGVQVLNGFENVIGGPAPAQRNVISGLEIGVEIRGDSAANAVKNSYIGTNAGGTQALANATGVIIGFGLGPGVVTGADGNVIGGTSAAERNMISGNTLHGVRIGGGIADSNLIRGNRIGTDVTGTQAVPNAVGVLIESLGNTICGTAAGAGNLISGNSAEGVKVLSGAGNMVLGNYIGTDVSGSLALGNGGLGVSASADGTVIGDGSLAGINVISANSRGVAIPGVPASSGTSIKRNRIGTDISGTQALGNVTDGIFIGLNIVDVTVQNNVISGNGGRGIWAFEGGSGLVIRSNRVGTDVSGAAPLGNAGDGMLIKASGTIVGGPSALANTVAFNGGAGVAVDPIATGVALVSNLIHSNAGIGIDLGADGVTPNDPDDPDGGANNLQNFLVLIEALSGSLLVRGSLDSVPNTDFRIQFFENDVCDPSGNGEGQAFLGSVVVTTDAGASASFTIFTPASLALGTEITTTTTNLTTNDTSEFSNCVEVEQAPPSTPTPTPTPTPTATPIGETLSPSPTGPTPSPSPTPTATPIPLQSDPPTATAAPTPTATANPSGSPPTSTDATSMGTPPSGESVAWGDGNCSGSADPVDSLLTLRIDAGLPANTGDCPAFGTTVDVAFASLHVWGDVDCSGFVNPIDSLKLLRYDAGLGVTQEPNCPLMGAEVMITES